MEIILGVSHGQVTVHLPGEKHRFELNDYQGVADLLKEHLDAILLCSSSCDYPQDDGAPADWKWDDFWAKVCTLMPEDWG